MYHIDSLLHLGIQSSPESSDPFCPFIPESIEHSGLGKKCFKIYRYVLLWSVPIMQQNQKYITKTAVVRIFLLFVLVAACTHHRLPMPIYGRGRRAVCCGISIKRPTWPSFDRSLADKTKLRLDHIALILIFLSELIGLESSFFFATALRLWIPTQCHRFPDKQKTFPSNAYLLYRLYFEIFFSCFVPCAGLQ